MHSLITATPCSARFLRSIRNNEIFVPVKARAPVCEVTFAISPSIMKRTHWWPAQLTNSTSEYDLFILCAIVFGSGFTRSEPAFARALDGRRENSRHTAVGATAPDYFEHDVS